MDELAAQMNNLNIGRNSHRNPQNSIAVPQVAAPIPEAIPVQNFEEPQVVPNRFLFNMI